MDETAGPPRIPLQKLLWGVILITAGILFTLDNIDVIDIGDYWRLWPLILVAMGIARMVQPEKKERRSSGVWLVMIGAWLLIGSFGLFGLTYGSSWPLLIVAVGISTIWQAIADRENSSQPKGENNGLK